jgi:hypothetical protein
MLSDKFSDSVTNQSHSGHQLGRAEKRTAIRDGFLAPSRTGVAAIVVFDAFTIEKARSGKRVRESLPTALGGRIPQQPVFVPAVQKPTPSP